MAAFQTLDALSTLSTSVPDWIQRLDELNNTIAQRQTELAKLTGDYLPPTPSIKNKGSTESLRPRDGTTPPPHDPNENFESSLSAEANASHIVPCAVKRSSVVVTAPVSGPRSSPAELSRKLSQNTPTNQGRFGLRKRKTESMLTTESQAPKYRTRSMIIVYYDSTVQAAFEDLVKFISANRNSMRKGKMNAKMEAMKRAAEQDAQYDDDDDDDDDDDENEEEYSIPKFTNARSPLSISRTLGGPTRNTQPLPLTSSPPIAVDNADSTKDELSQLKFVSTRSMGPPRLQSTSLIGRLPPSLASRSSRFGGSSYEVNDIFDVLDNGLEWCQGQCERAAHQFLRDGDCSDEMAAIKKRLLDVKSRSDKEVERLQKEEAANPRPAPRIEVKSRELRGPMMRKATLLSAVKSEEVDKRIGLYGDKARTKKVGIDSPKIAHADVKTIPPSVDSLVAIDHSKALIEADNRKLEVDTMEVDEDEGVEEDIEIPPMLTFRRTRDMVR